MISKQTGIRRLYYATLYSVKGLKAAFLSEPAVRQELAAMCILIPVAFYIDVTTVERILLILVLFIVLITEMLNSAIEALADRVSSEIHVLIAKAKDIGSGAVFLSLILAGLTWGLVLIN